MTPKQAVVYTHKLSCVASSCYIARCSPCDISDEQMMRKGIGRKTVNVARLIWPYNGNNFNLRGALTKKLTHLE